MDSNEIGAPRVGRFVTPAADFAASFVVENASLAAFARDAPNIFNKSAELAEVEPICIALHFANRAPLSRRFKFTATFV